MEFLRRYGSLSVLAWVAFFIRQIDGGYQSKKVPRLDSFALRSNPVRPNSLALQLRSECPSSPPNRSQPVSTATQDSLFFAPF